jgi:hypothetical protein
MAVAETETIGAEQRAERDEIAGRPGVEHLRARAPSRSSISAFVASSRTSARFLMAMPCARTRRTRSSHSARRRA